MLDAGTFREIVSGRRDGFGATLARGAFRAAEVPYTWAIQLRNGSYDRHSAKAVRVEVPVVSVGNLTLGGTGKTPMVKWIARRFVERGMRVALVSRGYGAVEGAKNDEALELEQALPGVPHVQNPDRVVGARSAIERFGVELIVLDDGFQHRRLARDLDVVLLDATEPFGFGHVFPRGMLREPVEGLRRAQVVCLSRADLLDAAGRDAVRKRVTEIAPAAVWCEAAHRPAELRNAAGETNALSAIAGRKVAAFSGIGNPAAFRKTVVELGAEVVWWREFGDHHRYSADDERLLAEQVVASGAELVVTTHKDLVKLPQTQLGGLPLWAVAIELAILRGENVLGDALDRVAATAARSES